MNQEQFEKEFVNRVHHGKCLKVMRRMPDNCVDTVITDPPYGLGFMGKDWDTFDRATLNKKRVSDKKRKPRTDGRKTAAWKDASDAGTYDFSRNREFQKWCKGWAKEALRVAKPGAILLCCGGTRTFHRLVSGIEDAGWLIKDCVLWLYGSGFPKSLDISKAIDLAKKTKRKVVGEHKVDIGIRSGSMHAGRKSKLVTVPLTVATSELAKLWDGWGTALKPAWEPIVVAMKPLDGTFAQNVEKWGVGGLNIAAGRIDSCAKSFQDNRVDKIQKNAYGKYGTSDYDGTKGRWPANLILDTHGAKSLDGFANGASRFFYTAKASKSERERENNHPTVKPLSLMRYLCNLTRTPIGGVVLDPFGGSGTTAVACIQTKRRYIVIEKKGEYCQIARERLRKVKTGIPVSLQRKGFKGLLDE